MTKHLMGREELIEVMKKAIEAAGWRVGAKTLRGERVDRNGTFAEAALSAIEGAGFAFLPTVLTTAMRQAAQDFEVSLSWEQADDLWNAMISAYSPQTRGEG